jgi:hypothetical protein
MRQHRRGARGRHASVTALAATSSRESGQVAPTPTSPNRWPTRFCCLLSETPRGTSPSLANRSIPATDQEVKALRGQTKRREVEVELTGLEPATSWVRSVRIGAEREATRWLGDFPAPLKVGVPLPSHALLTTNSPRLRDLCPVRNAGRRALLTSNDLLRLAASLTLQAARRDVPETACAFRLSADRPALLQRSGAPVSHQTPAG